MHVPTGWWTAGWLLIMMAAAGFGWVLGCALAARLMGTTWTMQKTVK